MSLEIMHLEFQAEFHNCNLISKKTGIYHFVFITVDFFRKVDKFRSNHVKLIKFVIFVVKLGV